MAAFLGGMATAVMLIAIAIIGFGLWAVGGVPAVLEAWGEQRHGD